MSELGQKRPKLPWLPAAKSTTEQRVKFVPQGDICSAANCILFDHIVGAVEQRRRHGEAERLGRLGVDEYLEFGRQEDGNLAWLRAFQNLNGHVGSAAAEGPGIT